MPVAGCVPASHLIKPPHSSAVVTNAPLATPSRARFQYLAAQMELARGDTAAAAAALDVAALHDPDSPWIELARADVALAAHDSASELAHAQAASSLAPTNGLALARVGEILAAQGERSTAEEVLRNAVDHGADDRAWSVLTRLLVSRAAPDAASMVARWAARPAGDGAAVRERGEARVRTGDDSGAVDDLGLALGDAPDDARLLDEYVGAASRARRFRTALIRLQSLHRLLPTNDDIVLRTWHLAKEANDPLRGLEALLALDTLQGGRDAQVAVWMAEERAAVGDVSGALQALDVAAKRVPPAADLSVHRARVFARVGRNSEALAALRIPATGPLRTEAIALQASLLVASRRTREARDLVERALVALPDSATLLSAEARVCIAANDVPAALSAIERLPMGEEDRALERARALSGAGDVKGANSILESRQTAGALALRLGVMPMEDPDRAALARALLAVDPGNGAATLVVVEQVQKSLDGALLSVDTKALLAAAIDRAPADTRLLDALAKQELAMGNTLRAAALAGEAERYRVAY